MKKIFLMLLTLTLLFSAITIPTAAAVAPGNTVSPMWTNTSFVNYHIIFDGNTGYAECSTTAKASPKTITIDVYVYAYINSNWVYVTENHVTKTGMVCAFSHPFSATSGVTYKADFTITVTGNGIDEVITTTSEKVCP